ncbi:MAG: DUF4169 family protein [Dongiaceae bacterium]
MGEIINFNKQRKHRQYLEDRKRAAENRVRFGRNKANRAATKAERNRDTKSLDDKRLD